MRLLPLTLIAGFVAWSQSAAAQSNTGITVLDNPGGGTIAYAQMPAQHTLPGAMGKVLQYAHRRFGARPQISRVMRGSDGSSLAVIFTVKPPGQGNPEIAGLALVAVSPSAAGKGAVLTDQADRFRSTVGPMLKLLQSGAGLSGPKSSPASAAAIAPASAPESPGAPAAPLHQTPFPDGSGSIGLPDGWTITGAHAGEVTAQGPAPAALHFDWQIPALDPNDPRSRGLMRPGTAAGFVDIPYGTDAATTFRLALTQFLQKRGKAPPTIEIVESTQVGPKEALVSARMGAIDGHGPTTALVDIGIGAPNNQGSYLITLYIISFPQELAQRSQATVVAMLHSYKVNQDVQLAQIQADAQRTQQMTAQTLAEMRRRQAASDQQFAAYQRRQDTQERQFQAFDNNLLDRTVIRDTDLNAHGTVSNDLADALVDANPNRFQEVSPSEYVKGIDY
ncbi:MAG: hypothetical protein WB440_12305 [Steroidobacteraceae bacterium]|jgi:hypothetical protein